MKKLFFLLLLILLIFGIKETFAAEKCNSLSGFYCVPSTSSCNGSDEIKDANTYTCDNSKQMCCGPTKEKLEEESSTDETDENSTIITFKPIIGDENSTMSGFLENILGRLQSIVAYLALFFIVLGAVFYTIAPANKSMVDKAKACWTSALIGLAIVLAGPSFLKQLKDISLAGDSIPSTIDAIPSVQDVLKRALGFLLSIIGSLAIIGLVLSGFFYIFAIGDKGSVDKAKEAMKYSIMGIVLASVSLALINQVAEFFAK